MLTVEFDSRCQPAAGNRRRLLLYLALSWGVATLACQSRPETDTAPFRAAAARAVRLVRPEQPRRARLLEEMMKLAEAATAAERATPWWEGSVGRSESAWLRTLREAGRACVDSRSSRDRLLKAASGLLQPTRDEVARARSEFRETGMERREATSISRAQASLAVAEKMIAIGRYDEAAKHLERARADATVVHKGWAGMHARFADPTLVRQWRAWTEATIEESRRSGGPAILIDKLRRQITLYRAGRSVARFHAELGANGLRRKEHAGDHATPEGRYRVVERKDGSSTKYYKALLINYPNDEDRMRFALAKRRGQISEAQRIGNLIEIHGDGGQGRDWTAGCVALANDDMDRVFGMAGIGTPVTIVGTYAD